MLDGRGAGAGGDGGELRLFRPALRMRSIAGGLEMRGHSFRWRVVGGCGGFAAALGCLGFCKYDNLPGDICTALRESHASG